MYCATLETYTYQTSDCSGTPYVTTMSITDYTSSTGLNFGSTTCINGIQSFCSANRPYNVPQPFVTNTLDTNLFIFNYCY